MRVYSWSNKDFFKKIDVNNHGFIVIDEFISRVNKIAKIP